MKFSDKFICANRERCDFDNHVPSPYLRKVFTLDFLPKTADITICGLGFYRLWINGAEITKSFLAPYISAPSDLVYYDNYDLAGLIKKGENVIGIQLGNGLRNAFGGWPWGINKIKDSGPVCTALYLDASDDTNNFILEADESFKVHPSPITLDDIRVGCYYDARLEIPNWNTVGFDDSKWQNALFTKSPGGEKRLCPVKINVLQEIKPVKIEHFDTAHFAHESAAKYAKPLDWSKRNDVYVFDFGVVTSGVSKLKINGEKDQVITIRHGDLMIDDGFTVSNITCKTKEGEFHEKCIKYNNTDVYTCKGGNETFIPQFKYDGFRYCFVEGLKPEQVNEDTLTFIEFSSVDKNISYFNCSNDVINKLYECTLRSDRSNMIYFPTDCPHREKNGWTGDAAVSAEQFLLNYDCAVILKEWMNSVRKSQRENGMINSIIPGGSNFNWGQGPVWDKVISDVPYYVFKYSGDKSVITENADTILKYLEHAKSFLNNKNLTDYGLGDWCSPAFSHGMPVQAPLLLTSSISLYDIAAKAEYLFNIAGLENQAETAGNFAKTMRKSIRENLIDFDNMTAYGDCQASQAFAIGLNIFNENELPSAIDRLVEIIHRDGDENECGILGMRYILHLLSDHGYIDLAYKLVTSKSSSSFGYWIENGATTLWESFAPLDHTRVDSRDHHFYGDISSWMIQDIVGIRPNYDVCGENKYMICPHFPSDLKYAEAHFDFDCGRVKCCWTRENNKIKITVSAPKELDGRLVIGDTDIDINGELEYYI